MHCTSVIALMYSPARSSSATPHGGPRQPTAHEGGFGDGVLDEVIPEIAVLPLLHELQRHVHIAEVLHDHVQRTRRVAQPRVQVDGLADARLRGVQAAIQSGGHVVFLRGLEEKEQVGGVELEQQVELQRDR